MKKQSFLLFLVKSSKYDKWKPTDFGISKIQSFVNKVNTEFWNDCRVYLTDGFYYKVNQNRAILATHDSLLDHG